MTWYSIPCYFDKFADQDAKRRCKNQSQKRKYITDVLNMPLQFDKGSKQFAYAWSLKCVCFFLVVSPFLVPAAAAASHFSHVMP